MDLSEAEHKEVGWSKLDEVHGKCMSCDKDVFILIKVQESEHKFSYFANCPYCNSKTWTKKVEGKYILGFPENLHLWDSVYENDIFELKVSK